MRILYFTKYTRKGASSRLRTYLYLDGLRRRGHTCDVSPFFTDAYLEELYTTRRHNKWQALQSFLRRTRDLLRVSRYDRVVIEKELFPYFPAVAEFILWICGVKYIVDYDDAIFHNYDQSKNPVIRTLLSGKIKIVMRRAYIVVAGNAYLQAYAERCGARKVVIIPTVIDTQKYRVKESFDQGPLVAGWIGSPITAKYLHFLKPIFSTLAAEYPVRLRMVGAKQGIGLGAAEEVVPWSEATEADVIRTFDVGIMPLEDNIWERGKCGYKLIQYMGCGVPVIGTPIGVNATIIRPGVNGFQATTEQEWMDAIRYFLTHRAELKSIGEKGRAMVEEGFSLQKYETVWNDILTTG